MCWCWDKLSNSDGAKQSVCQTMTKCRFSSSYRADDEATCEGDDFQMFARTTVHIQNLLNTLIKSSQWHLMCVDKGGLVFFPRKDEDMPGRINRERRVKGQGSTFPSTPFKKKKKEIHYFAEFSSSPIFFHQMSRTVAPFAKRISTICKQYYYMDIY